MTTQGKDIELSKSLSWLLRHGALQEGLNFSAEGYVPIDEVLAHRIFRRKIELKDIQRIVQNDNKQRYKIRKNLTTKKLEIKAHQGHTITVASPELVSLHTAKYKSVIHGTFYHNWVEIRKNGLFRGARQHIHFAKDLPGEKERTLRHNAAVHIYIDLKKAIQDGIPFYESENGVVLTPGDKNGILAPKYFSKVIRVDTGEEIQL